MKIPFLFSCAIVAGHFALAEPVPVNDPLTPPRITTGTRDWRMRDGSIKRLRFINFTNNGKSAEILEPGNRSVVSLLKFAEEEQEVFKALKDGSLKLVTTPDLCMEPNFPNGKLKWVEGILHYCGALRTWENANGKHIKARLICLTDMDVSLLMAGDTVGRVRLDNLSPADLAYLERIKSGAEPLYADRKIWPHIGWGDADYRIMLEITGEHAAALADKGSDFENALASVLQHVASKLEPNQWELDSFVEDHSFELNRPGSGDQKKCAFLYTARFAIDKSVKEKAREYWPLTVNPKSWTAPPGLMIYVWADGEIAKVIRHNSFE